MGLGTGVKPCGSGDDASGMPSMLLVSGLAGVEACVALLISLDGLPGSSEPERFPAKSKVLRFLTGSPDEGASICGPLLYATPGSGV